MRDAVYFDRRSANRVSRGCEAHGGEGGRAKRFERYVTAASVDEFISWEGSAKI